MKDIQEHFSKPLLAWFAVNGRYDLPWKQPLTAYRVWLSEIMLQQTQVATVIPYFHAFIQQFPTLESLAKATEDEVLSLWSGLGYYSRARNLHKTAVIIWQDYQGHFPNVPDVLSRLPGIGPSTAAAIVAQSFDLPYAILDANVKRVLSRFFMVEGQLAKASVLDKLWQLANLCMPAKQCADYTQAIMDLGALCCTNKKPQCDLCPLQLHCQAYQKGVQEQYPHKKIPKIKPTKQCQLLVLVNSQGEIYLEKRPPHGIWGGLWCLPSIAVETSPLGYIQEQYGLLGEEPNPIIAFKHSFTHFHLEIAALAITTKFADELPRQCKGQWYFAEQLPKLGLAKPTKKILDQAFKITSN